MNDLIDVKTASHVTTGSWYWGPYICLYDPQFKFQHWISLVLKRRQSRFEYSWGIGWCKFNFGSELGLNFVGCRGQSCYKRRFSRRENGARQGQLLSFRVFSRTNPSSFKMFLGSRLAVILTDLHFYRGGSGETKCLKCRHEFFCDARSWWSLVDCYRDLCSDGIFLK